MLEAYVVAGRLSTDFTSLLVWNPIDLISL